ncbi:Coenzyme F420 hydrogenase/dehydrogenase, beta subunit C-terminal domain [Qipengyuania citrea]|nr:Coenzyme F420 hydrogenase/dehydrogenase, beta subunit C-terminal domain [Qipengyuania citrea]
MELSSEGFLRPTDHDVLARTDADDICPGISLAHARSDVRYHPLWGPVVSVRTGYANDAEIRYSGSSGGALSAFCIGLIETGKVEFVWHTKADPDDPIGNRSGMSRNRAGIIAAAGSRYGPSNPLADLEEALATNESFAFIGKPCDVAGLAKLAKLDPRIDRQIIYRMAFFCAGVPSRQSTIDLLGALRTNVDDVRTFRYRGDGWPGLARVVRKDGSTAAMDYNASWGGILNRGLQFRCKICADGTGEFADLSFADAWYGEDGYPDFEERDGRSLIIARTAKGAELLNTLEEEGYFTSSPQDIESVEGMQPYQVHRKRSIFARSVALRIVFKRAPVYLNFQLIRLCLGQSLKKNLQTGVGMALRAVRKSAS